MMISLCPGFEIESKFMDEFQKLIDFRYETSSPQSIVTISRMARLFAAIGITSDILKCTLDITGSDSPTYLRNLISKSSAVKLHNILLMLGSEDTLCSMESSNFEELLAGTYMLLRNNNDSKEIHSINDIFSSEQEASLAECIFKIDPPLTWQKFQACLPMALGVTNLYIPARIYRWLDNIDIPETVLRNSAIGFLMLTNVIKSETCYTS